ncbi:hypothetical protein Tsubulata_041670, partial [Turnera subulata]
IHCLTGPLFFSVQLLLVTVLSVILVSFQIHSFDCLWSSGNVNPAALLNWENARSVHKFLFKTSKKTDGASFLQLKLPSKSRLQDGAWNFLESYDFRYGDSHARALLPFEIWLS